MVVERITPQRTQLAETLLIMAVDLALLRAAPLVAVTVTMVYLLVCLERTSLDRFKLAVVLVADPYMAALVERVVMVV